VRIFASMSAIESSPLAVWSPDRADPSERLLVSHLHHRLCEHATVERPDFKSEEQETERPALHPLLAVPHYYDLGLLVQRTDLLQGIRHPTYWDAAADAPNDGSGSFEKIVSSLSRRIGVPGFAFKHVRCRDGGLRFYGNVLEFFRNTEFHGGRREQTPNLDRATEAMTFLCRLRSQGTLPYPCTLQECSQAIYSRVWYANIANMQEQVSGGSLLPLTVVPFFLSAEQFKESFRKEKGSLLTCVEQQQDRHHKRAEKLQNRFDDIRKNIHIENELKAESSPGRFVPTQTAAGGAMTNYEQVIRQALWGMVVLRGMVSGRPQHRRQRQSRLVRGSRGSRPAPESSREPSWGRVCPPRRSSIASTRTSRFPAWWIRRLDTWKSILWSGDVS